MTCRGGEIKIVRQPTRTFAISACKFVIHWWRSILLCFGSIKYTPIYAVLQIMKEISITTELMAVGLYSHTLWCTPHGVCVWVHAGRNYCYFCAAQSAPERENTLGRARRHQFSILNRWVWKSGGGSELIMPPLLMKFCGRWWEINPVGVCIWMCVCGAHRRWISAGCKMESPRERMRRWLRRATG